MSVIPAEKLAEIIDVLPILCVDIVMQNAQGEYLLVKRINEPRKDQWWVIGGRVLKGETLEEAARRKVSEETALQVETMQPIGYYEAVAQANPFGLRFQYHAVSVVFMTVVDSFQAVRLDSQSAEWKFAKELPSDFRVRSFNEHGSEESERLEKGFLSKGERGT